jgi:excisionase family DNA binding protein
MVNLELTDDLVRELFERARTLGLLPEPEPEPEWLTAKEAAEYVHVTLGTLRNFVSNGRLPRRYPKGHKARFLRSDLDAHLATGERE